MQSGKNAVEAAKEKVMNVNATALSGMEKAKATAQEKADKMMKSDPMEKDRAEQRKEEKIREVEAEKQKAFHDNALRKEQASHTGVGAPAAHGTGPGSHGHTGVVNAAGTEANPLGSVAGQDHAAAPNVVRGAAGEHPHGNEGVNTGSARQAAGGQLN